MEYIVYIKDLEESIGVSLKKITEFIKNHMGDELVGGPIKRDSYGKYEYHYNTHGSIFVNTLDYLINREKIIEQWSDNIEVKSRWEENFKKMEKGCINHKTYMRLLEEFNPEKKEQVLKEMEKWSKKETKKWMDILNRLDGGVK